MHVRHKMWHIRKKRENLRLSDSIHHSWTITISVRIFWLTNVMIFPIGYHPFYSIYRWPTNFIAIFRSHRNENFFVVVENKN